MSEIHDFSFDDEKVIKVSGCESFQQNKPGMSNRISIVAFKTHHDSILAQKTREKQSPLSEPEKAEIVGKVEKKLAEQLGKKPEELTDVDRLNWKAPKFSYSWTHFAEGGIGTIRCLGDYEGTTCTRPDICCNKFGEAEQAAATIVIVYPTNEQLSVEEDLLKARKMTSFNVWKMRSKKFKSLEATYVTQREDSKFTIDLRVTLDGDPKYQKQKIESVASAFWARESFDAEARNWVLDQGIRLYKYVPDYLGFSMKKEMLLEKLGVGGGSVAAAEEKPRLNTGYSNLID